MPQRIVLDWQDKTLVYLYRDSANAYQASFESLYDVLELALANGYRSRPWGDHILVLELDR